MCIMILLKKCCKKIISLRVLVSGWADFILMILHLHFNEQHRTNSSPLLFVTLLYPSILFFLHCSFLQQRAYRHIGQSIGNP